MKTRSALLSVVMAATTVCAVHAQNESDIVAKLHTALLHSADNIVDLPVILKGKMTLRQIVMDGAIYYQRPVNRLELSVSGMKFITLSTDSTRWTFNPADNSHKIEQLSKDQVNDERQRGLLMDFAAKDLLSYKTRGLKLKNLGIKKVDSVETHNLQLTLADKNVVDYFINTKTNLIYKAQLGDEARVYANYRRYGDYLYPTFISMITKGGQMDVALNEVVINATISPDLLIIPQEAYDARKKREANLEAMIAKAETFYQEKKYTEANDEYSNVLRDYGHVFRAYNGRGLAKIAVQKYYEAVGDFNSALEVVPNNGDALNNRGLAKYYIGDFKGAIDDYSAAIKADSTHVVAFRNRGVVYFDQQKYAEAAAEFKKAIQLKPDHPESQYRYGICLAQLEQYEGSINAYNKALSLGLKSAGVYNHIGVAYYKLESYDSAATSFKNALAIEKEDLQYLENYGNALYALAKYKEAVRQFESYVAVKKDNDEIYNMIGLCKYQEEDYKGAIQQFTKSIELNPKGAVYFDNRASAKEQIDDYDGAISDYSESIALYPNDAETFFKRGMLKIQTSKKLEGCMDLGTANEMKHEGAKEAILKNCN